MAGSGKRTKMLEQLQKIAQKRGLPFTIQTKSLAGAGGGISEEGGEEAADVQEGNQITYESSLVHTGFDIARMSMQDKQVLRPIFMNLGHGSHVLAGEQGRGARILVLYHSHLLSSESILLLQACLEQNEDDISIWLTSELPVSQRIRDWFVEIPWRVPTGDLRNSPGKFRTVRTGPTFSADSSANGLEAPIQSFRI